MNKTKINITKALDSLGKKLNKLEISSLEISDYNKGYLKKYQDNFNFYSAYYQQLLESVIQVEKRIDESTFIDYGGGCGILSYLACELGFDTIIYNDIFEQSVKDVEEISANLGFEIDYFVTGDINDLVSFVKQEDLQVDYICSFDVLEHIYDLKSWFTEVRKLNGNWSLGFITSANGANPFVEKRLKKIHYTSEYIGFEKDKKWKEMDTSLPYLKVRENMIKRHFETLDNKDVEKLAKATRGLREDDLILLVKEYLETRQINYKINHSTNTCDPHTGNWNENLINTKELLLFIDSKGMKSKIINTKYGYSKNKLILNIPKFLVNKLIGILPKKILKFSPMYIVLAQKE